MRNKITVSPTILLVALLAYAGSATAQTFTVLKALGAPKPTGMNGISTNSDGAYPYGGRLLLHGDRLYGTLSGGGTAGKGVIFRMHPDGTGYVVLKTFSAGGNNSVGRYTNSDGAGPVAGLTASAGTLYGTTPAGGINGSGTVFRVNTNGTGFTVLKHFSAWDPVSGINSDGATPYAGVTLSSPADVLYGTTIQGGNSGSGTVFKMFIDGTGYTVLKHFSALVFQPIIGSSGYFNDDGAGPYHGELTLSSDLSPVLYGMTYYGGTGSWGTVFRIKTDGTGFTNLHNFTGGDGSYPEGTLALAGNEELYGTTYLGGSGDNGTIFKMLKDGRDFTVLKHFSASEYNPTIGASVNDDGANPLSGVILSGNVLYGTAIFRGSTGNGTVFKLFTDGTGFNVLKTFSIRTGSGTNSDGALPFAGLTLSGTVLYGAAQTGGSGGGGTLFSIGLFLSSQHFSINTADGNFGFTNQQFRFTINGPAGSNVLISASTNNQTWTPLATNALTGGASVFTDTSASNYPSRFYQAQLLP